MLEKIWKKHPLEIMFLVGLGMFLTSIIFTESLLGKLAVLTSFIAGQIMATSVFIWKLEKEKNAEKSTEFEELESS